MKTVIEVTRLSKAYKEINAAEDISFSVYPGECFGLLGSNGAGKSTTMECILGTRTQDLGEVSILGMSPQKDRRNLFQRVGVQFQEGNYQDKIKVAELCEVSASLYKAPLDHRMLLQQFGLSEKANRPVSELSGGQKQCLFIILSLLPDPEVIFLDELTTGLDVRARKNVWKFLFELKAKGITILLTSHFMDEVEALCDRIMILQKGKSIFCGTVEEAVAHSPFENFEDAYLWYTSEEEEHARF